MEEIGFPLRLILAVLAVWRVTHLLSSEDGPGDLIVKFRARLGSSLAGKLMDCFYCLSLWVALPVACLLANRWSDRLLLWLSISGAVCLLERLGGQPIEAMQSFATLEGGDSHVLRPETNRIPEEFTDPHDSKP